MLPTRVIEHGDEVAGTETQDFAQMRQLLAIDDAAVAVNLCFRQKKPRHDVSLSPLQKQRYPFSLSRPADNSEPTLEATNYSGGFLLQDSG